MVPSISTAKMPTSGHSSIPKTMRVMTSASRQPGRGSRSSGVGLRS